MCDEGWRNCTARYTPRNYKVRPMILLENLLALIKILKIHSI